jgi:4-hydroxy-2-oxoheptanedioate aldolase
MSSLQRDPGGSGQRALPTGRPALLAWCHLATVARTWDFVTMQVDAVVVDLQHGDADVSALAHIVSALEQQDVAPMVRLSSGDPAHIGRVLDEGVHGVIVPQVDSAKQAEDAVAACYYPPSGNRSYGPQGRFRGNPVCIAQIETLAGLDAVAAIAATSGLDGIYVGPWDLGLALGAAAPGSITDPAIEAAVHHVADTCRGAGTRWGVHTTNTAAAGRAHSWGADLINVVADQASLADRAAAVGEFVERLHQEGTDSTTE